MITATFAGVGHTGANLPGSFIEIVSKRLPPGCYAVTATITTRIIGQFDDQIRDLDCELRANGGYIGGSSDRRVIPENDEVRRSVSMNGGALITEGGGEVGLYCRTSATSEVVENAQIMLISLDGFA